MTAHAHHWLISSPVSVDDGPPTTDWACRTCGEVRLNVPEWRAPAQFFLTPKYQRLQRMEEL